MDKRFIDVMTEDTEAALREGEAPGLYNALFLAGEMWGTGTVRPHESPRLRRLIECLDAALRAKGFRPMQDHRLLVELHKLFDASKFGIEDTTKLDVRTTERLQQLVRRDVLTYVGAIAKFSGQGYWPARFHCVPAVKWGLILYRMQEL